MKNSYHSLSELSAFTFLCLLTRVPWLFMVPMYDAPDEVSHLWVVKYLTEHARFPTHIDVSASGAAAVYGPLPQLGYLPHAAIIKFLPFWNIAITARLGSLAMGLCLVWLAYFIGREIYATNRLAGLALPVVVIFHPQMVFLNSCTNSDSTAATLSALILMLVVRMIRRGLKLWECALVGLTSGLALLSKYSALSVVAAAGFGLLAAGWLNGASWQLITLSVSMTGGVFALSTGWWFLRELHEYPGDLLGTKTMRHIWAVDTKKAQVYNSGLWAVIADRSWWRMMYYSFWGNFGYMTNYLFRPFLIAYLIFTLTAIAGGISRIKYAGKLIGLIKLKLNVKNVQDIPESSLGELKIATIYVMFFVSILVNISAMVWSSSLNLGGPQGRYLFVNEIPIVALTISGIMSLNKKYNRKLLYVFIGLNVVSFLWASVKVYMLYFLGVPWSVHNH